MSVKLRSINKNDLKKIMDWRMLPEVTKYMYTDPNLTIEQQEKWYNSIKNSKKDMYWIIELDNQIDVGLISINNIDTINKKCSWAYYIADQRARGKGLGTILECNIYDFVFDRLQLNKLWCEVFLFNEKVISIHKKFGSEIEGTFKDHIYKNGEYYDVVNMAIHKSKWDKIKSTYKYNKIEIEEKVSIS